MNLVPPDDQCVILHSATGNRWPFPSPDDGEDVV